MLCVCVFVVCITCNWFVFVCMYICVCVFGTTSHCSAVVHVQVVHFAVYFSCFFSIDRYGLNVLSCNVQYTEAASLVYICRWNLVPYYNYFLHIITVENSLIFKCVILIICKQGNAIIQSTLWLYDA